MEAQGSLSKLQLDRIQEKVPEGETLLWVGQEPPQRFWLRRALRLVLYGIWVFLAAALNLRWYALPTFLRRNLNATMLPELSLLVLTGLGGFLLVREALRLRRSRPDGYALTTRRALVIPAGRQASEWRYDRESACPLRVRQRIDGSGDIVFDHRRRWVNDPDGRARRECTAVIFYGVPCVEEVLRLLEAPGLGVDQNSGGGETHARGGPAAPP